MYRAIVVIATILFASMIMASCGPSPEQLALSVQATVSSIPTATAYPTYTPFPTYTPNPPYPTYTIPATYTPVIVVVTATGTPTPLYTPTITNTPEPTKDPTMQDKGDGFYLVGIDIAAGLWRSTGTQDNCYWAITDKKGDIIDNHFGMAGGTMFIPASAFQVQLEDCGTWTYLGQ